MPAAATATPVPTPSCDRCRTRKVKCTPLADDDLAAARSRGVGNRCKGCYRADRDCSYNYVHKKPGRPLGSGAGKRRGESVTDSARSGRELSPSSITNSLGLPLGIADGVQLGGDGGIGPASGSIFGSARTALYPTYTYPPPQPLYEPAEPSIPIMPELGLGLQGHSEIERVLRESAASLAGNFLQPQTALKPHSDHPSVPSLDGPLDLGGPGESRSYEQGLSLDDVLDWTDVCYFVSLFLKDQHCLVPLVHKPTFSQDVLNRRDKRDEAFRGLLCSLVAYTICQCPISTMTGAYERPRLVTMLHRCTKAADAIRHRQRLAPSLILLASTILDWITAQAVGNPQVCDLLIAETTRQSRALGLSETTPRAGANVVELEICRRLYWILYSKDKTDALSGRPIGLNDFEGLAPLPLEIDDDYITTEGHLPQPAHKTSYMNGFVSVMRIFKVISQCVAKHRAFANSSALDEWEKDTDALRSWICKAQEQIRKILGSLPPSLRADQEDDEESAADPSLFGIQAANITITALCAEFALLDFVTSICPDEDTRTQREEMARKAYETLSGVPIEYLASNGESMRGKVLRIILTLLSMTTEPINFSQNVWDWWNMYSRVQFLQVIPDETMILIDQNQRPSPMGVVSAHS